MNRALSLILLIVLSQAIAGAASFEIVLENGRSLKTSLYWKEDGEIRFFIYGGEMGVPASAVKEIRRLPNKKLEPDAHGMSRSDPTVNPQDRVSGQAQSIMTLDQQIAELARETRDIDAMSMEELNAAAETARDLRKRIQRSPQAEEWQHMVAQLSDILESIKNEMRRKAP